MARRWCSWWPATADVAGACGVKSHRSGAVPGVPQELRAGRIFCFSSDTHSIVPGIAVLHGSRSACSSSVLNELVIPASSSRSSARRSELSARSSSPTGEALMKTASNKLAEPKCVREG